ncbi:MAG: hypothetical protein D4S02_01360 [Rhodocyclaceae bacterium]|nr:MAG: hypothetical protein D4S02_01360 [Rhodocyclaceae bacterium]
MDAGVAIKTIRSGKGGNSQTGPDADGCYTATLAAIIPDNARMVSKRTAIDTSLVTALQPHRWEFQLINKICG